MLLLRKKKRKRTHACLGALRRHGTPENITHQRLTAAIRSCMDKRRLRRRESLAGRLRRSGAAQRDESAQPKKRRVGTPGAVAQRVLYEIDRTKKEMFGKMVTTVRRAAVWAIGQWRSHAAAMLKAIVLFTNRTSSIAPRFDGPTSKTF